MSVKMYFIWKYNIYLLRCLIISYKKFELVYLNYMLKDEVVKYVVDRR